MRGGSWWEARGRCRIGRERRLGRTAVSTTRRSSVAMMTGTLTLSGRDERQMQRYSNTLPGEGPGYGQDGANWASAVVPGVWIWVSAEGGGRRGSCRSEREHGWRNVVWCPSWWRRR